MDRGEKRERKAGWGEHLKKKKTFEHLKKKKIFEHMKKEVLGQIIVDIMVVRKKCKKILEVYRYILP